MAVWSIVNKGNIEGSSRIDAEYYHPNILEAVQKVERTLNNKLGSLVKGGYRVVYENTNILSREEVNFERDCLFIQAANISSDGLSFDVDNMGYVHEADWIRYKKGRVIRGEVLIEVKGKAEKVAIVPSYVPERTLVSGTLYKLSLKKGMSHEYLYAYMSSKYGKLLRDRLKTNTLIAYVSKPDLYSIPVHLPREENDEEVKSLVLQAYKTVELSSKLYSQAEQILLEELGLKDLDLKDNLFYTTTLKEVKDNNRMDTEYYMPKYDYIFKALEKKGYNRLDSISKISKILLKKKSKIFYKYIEIGGIDASTGDVSCKEMKGCDLPTNAKLKISGGELIISKVRPTRGAIAIVPDYLTNNCLCSGAFSVFKIKSPIREYIQVFLRSKIGKVLLGHPSTGTQYPTITDEDVKVIPIPDLSKNVMENISNKVFNAHVKRESAKALLEQAKHKVEEMIEKEAGVK